MSNDICLAQTKSRLHKIKAIYADISPNYAMLTKGIIHNDLHIENIYFKGNKIFLIDFEHIKHGPVVSDIGVLLLSLWSDFKIETYEKLKKTFLSGYQKIISLNEYDIINIPVFTMRYLLSDENWYVYWSKKGVKNFESEISDTIKREKIIMKYIEFNHE